MRTRFSLELRERSVLSLRYRVKYNIIVWVVVEDVGRVNEIAQDELWFAVWCQFESLEKLVEALGNASVLISNQYLRMYKGQGWNSG